MPSCLVCKQGLKDGFCKSCTLPFRRQFLVGPRVGGLKKLVEIYKYQAVRAAS